MDLLWFCLLLFNSIYVVNSSTVRSVRLINHTSYAVSIIQKTISEVEKRHWCNLRVDDMSIGVRENVLSNEMRAEIDLKSGFVSSIQKIDIVRNSIVQMWMPVHVNTTRVEIQATVRMHHVGIGFDAITRTNEQVNHTTGLIVYPELQFTFNITKNLFTGDITTHVGGRPISTTNLMRFIPENEVTRVYTVLFDWNSTTPSISRWATDIFTPILLHLATEVEVFPRICYDC